jgi:tetratricopeptide (TPR) repeat protein
MSSDPLPKGANLQRAIALYHQGRFDRMEAEARAELARDPDDHEALTWLGLALLRLDRDDEALRVLGDASRLRPDYADAHYVRARVLWRQSQSKRLLAAMLSSFGGSYRQAEQDTRAQAGAALAEAIRLNPNSTEYLDFLADIHREQGRHEEALAIAERGLALNPQHVGCLYNRALALERLDRLEEARQAYGMALGQSPESAGLHHEYGKLLLRLDAPGPAVEHLREALRLSPNLEADARPLIAEAMKRQSRVYDWLGKNINSPWLIVGFVALLAALMWLGTAVQWKPFEVIHRDLPTAIPYVLLFLSVMTGLNPLFNLSLCRREFGRLMLSATERRQAHAVLACLLVALAAALWYLCVDKYTPILLCLFALFWIDPVAQSFDLYPRSLQRIAATCTALSILLVAGHLVWRWFAPDDTLKQWYYYLVQPLGAGFFLLLIPFILSRSSAEFSFWRPRARRRAVLVFWLLLILPWFVLVEGWFLAYLYLPDPATLESLPEEALPAATHGFHLLRQFSTYAGLVFGVALFLEKALIDWLSARFGGKPAS